MLCYIKYSISCYLMVFHVMLCCVISCYGCACARFCGQTRTSAPATVPRLRDASSAARASHIRQPKGRVLRCLEVRVGESPPFSNSDASAWHAALSISMSAPLCSIISAAIAGEFDHSLLARPIPLESFCPLQRRPSSLVKWNEHHSQTINLTACDRIVGPRLGRGEGGHATEAGSWKRGGGQHHPGLGHLRVENCPHLGRRLPHGGGSPESISLRGLECSRLQSPSASTRLPDTPNLREAGIDARPGGTKLSDESLGWDFFKSSN